MHQEQSSRKTLYWVIPQISIISKGLNSQKVFFSDHKEIKLEINNRKISEKNSPKCLKLNTYLSNPQVKNKIKREIRKYFEQEENENMRIYGMSPKQRNL